MAEREMELEDQDAPRPDGAGQSDGAQSIGGMIGTRNLLIIIVTMPLVFLAVVAGIVMTFGSPLDNKDRVRSSQSTVRSTPAASSSAETITSGQRAMLAIPASTGAGAIVLPEGATPGAISLDGDRLAVRVDDPDGAMVVIYDLAQRRVIQSVPIVKTAQAELIQPAVKIAKAAPISAPADNKQAGQKRAGQKQAGQIQAGQKQAGQKQPGQKQRGVTLAAPGVEPVAEPAKISLAAADLSVEPAGEPVAASPKIVPTPSLGARRTRYVTTPQ